jgi:DNA/RNA-binding domain of Phe-tRNA-synthetase-like protein
MERKMRMKAIRMDDALAEKLKIGALLLEGVQVAEARGAGLEGAAREAEGEVRAAYAGRTPAEIPGCRAARKLFRSIGVDPTRMRPASEALMRRILKGGEIPRINSAVDTGNVVSLSLLMPIGLYDADRIAGDVTLRLGREDESYGRIGSGRLNLAGRIGLFDGEGGFGNPTGDSARTCVTVRTERLLFVLFAPVDSAPESLADGCEFAAGAFNDHTGAVEAGKAFLGAGELVAELDAPRGSGE